VRLFIPAKRRRPLPSRTVDLGERGVKIKLEISSVDIHLGNKGMGLLHG